jgi:hypothetical protein
VIPEDALVRSRISVALAALVLAFTTAFASTASKNAYENLTIIAQRIDTAAQRGDWPTAESLNRQLHTSWADARPETLRGMKGKAYAQNFDASLKWISSAILQRSARNVHDAATNIEKSANELAARTPV